MAGHPIGEKAPIGNTDCPSGYGRYPLASPTISCRLRQHVIRINALTVYLGTIRGSGLEEEMNLQEFWHRFDDIVFNLLFSVFSILYSVQGRPSPRPPPSGLKILDFD